MKTTLMGLYKAISVDTPVDYLRRDLATSLDLIDAHKHDGTTGGNLIANLAANPWTSFVPTASQGVGLTIVVNYARYQVIGKTALVQIKVSISSAGTATNPIVVAAFPVAPKETGTYAICGDGMYLQSGVANWALTVEATTTTQAQFYSNNTTLQFGANPTVTAKNGDAIALNLSYEIA